MTRLEALDVALFRWCNGVAHTPFLDAFFVWITAPPYRVPLLLGLWLSLILLGGRKGRQAALLLLFVVLAADQISSTLLKPWIGRVRPCFALEGARLLLPRQPRSPSFPSGHATNAFAVAIVLFSVRRWLGWVGVAVAVLVAYSRVYVGVHYPSDLVGGAILGVFVAWGGLRLSTVLAERIAHRRKRPAARE